MTEKTRHLCPGCGRLIHIRLNAHQVPVFAPHNDKSRRSCKKSGEPIK